MKTFLAAALIFSASVATAQDQQGCVDLANIAMRIAEIRQTGVPMYALMDRIIADESLTDEARQGLQRLVTVVYMLPQQPRDVGRLVYATCMEGAA